MSEPVRWYLTGTINHLPSRAVALERLDRLGSPPAVVRHQAEGPHSEWWVVLLATEPRYEGQTPYRLLPGEDPLAVAREQRADRIDAAIRSGDLESLDAAIRDRD